MNELYWITVLGNLNLVGAIAIATGITILCVLCIMWLIGMNDYPYGNDVKKITKSIKWAIFLLIIGIGVNIFVPSTQQLYMIYGLGGTIDYIQENETAKQLPDKVMIALDKWIDNLNVTKDTKENEDE